MSDFDDHNNNSTQNTTPESTEPSSSTPSGRPLGRHHVPQIPAHQQETYLSHQPTPHQVDQPIDHATPRTTKPIKRYSISFTGTSSEFFKIWIVNIALTILTLGIYLPWARVRTQQYFYGHTWLDGHNFEYTANPLVLLRSYAIVFGCYAVFTITNQFDSNASYIISVLFITAFFFAYPWIVYQSMKFLARNTVYRGIRFGFQGSVADSYISYGLANLATLFTSGLALPWAWFMQRSYQFNNIAYGKSKGRFRGDLGNFYTIGLTGVALFAVSIFAIGGIGAIIAGISTIFSVSESSMDDLMSIGFVVGFLVIYLGVLLTYQVTWSYIHASTTKYVLENGELGNVIRSNTTINPTELTKIIIVNALVQIVTLGLMAPWARVRLHKYIVENIQIRSLVDLDTFQQAEDSDESGLGEAASDLFNIDVGF